MFIFSDCRPESCRTEVRPWSLRTICFSSLLAFMLMGIPQVQAAHNVPAPNDPSVIGAPTSTLIGVPAISYPGNLECSDFLHGTAELAELKVDASEFTTTTDVDINLSTSDKTFGWDDFDLGVVLGVISKGGPNGLNWYRYLTPVSSDSLLHSPVNKKGDLGGLSHISFCYIPGQPIINIEKSCPKPEFIDGGTSLLYTNVASVANNSTGGLDLFDVQIKETEFSSGDNCMITEVRLNGGANSLGAPVAMVAGWNDVPGFQGLTNPLLNGDIINLTLECETGVPISSNELMTRASREAGGDPATDDTDTANCPAPAPPALGISKECGDPMLRLLATSDAQGSSILAVQACVNITVRNLGDQVLQSVELEDTEVFGFEADGTTPVAVQVGTGTLTPDDGQDGSGADEVTETYCYLPDMPTGSVVTETNGETTYSVFTLLDLLDQGNLEKEALFSNTASAFAFAPVTATFLGPIDASSHCSICYSAQIDPELPSACPDPINVPFLLPIE